jgi:hypothetical protein
VINRALALRRAAAVVPVDGGSAVLDPRFPRVIRTQHAVGRGPK